MSVLEQVYASGGDIIIPTLELACEAWPDPVLITHGFSDQTVTVEDGRTLTFLAAGVDISLPKKTNSGGQELNFAIDNITGEAQRKIDEALEAQARVTLIYREFLVSDKSTPAQVPYRFIVRSGQMVGTAVQISAGFFDAINTAWPRSRYTSIFAPGIKYL